MGAIEVDELTKDYGDVLGIDSLSFTVEEGEVFGFLGPNGAGKTTAIRTLLGFQSPTSGNGRILGRDITDERALVKARREIGYLPAEPVFDEGATGRRMLSYYGDLRGDERSDELLERFTPPLDRKIGNYSRGNKQMLAIVLAFMHDPELIIMDEPTSGLDPLKQDRFIEFVAAVSDDATPGARPFALAVEYETDAGSVATSDPVRVTGQVRPERDLFAVEARNATFAPDSTNRLEVVVTNTGETVREDVVVALEPTQPFTSVAPEAYVPSLAPGESATVAFELSIDEDAVPSTHSLRLNVTAETAEEPTEVPTPIACASTSPRKDSPTTSSRSSSSPSSA